MEYARPDGNAPGETSTAATSLDQQVSEPLHALFYRRFAGDDALLELAGLRFTQTGLAAETYAETPGELEHVLKFVPPHRHLPTVHLNRGINLLHDQGRATVGEFADRFAGRVGGLVVHDQRDMGDQTDRLLTVLHGLDARLCERPDSRRLPRSPPTWRRPGWSSWRKSSRTPNGSASASTSATSASDGVRQVAAAVPAWTARPQPPGTPGCPS